MLSVMLLELESVSEISSPQWSSVYECQSVECAFTSPVIIELGKLGCGGELRFLYCDDVRLCCAHEMLEFLHGAPYAVCVELKNFYLFVFCF